MRHIDAETEAQSMTRSVLGPCVSKGLLSGSRERGGLQVRFWFNKENEWPGFVGEFLNRGKRDREVLLGADNGSESNLDMKYMLLGTR